MNGKSINNKSFYGGMETGKAPEIAMPDLNQPAPINEVANPWDAQQPQQNPGVAAVPQELPADVMEEFDNDELQEDEVEYQEQPVKQSKENSVAANMRSMREARERAERERDELMQLLQQQMRNQQPQQKQPEPEQEEDFDIDNDALVEGKALKQYNKKMTQQMKALQDQLKSYQAQSAEAIVEAKIKSQFPDFDKVVSRENVMYLNESNPEIARMLRDTPDMYDKAVSAYKVIKQFGIHKDPMMDRDHKRAIANVNKPRPLASVNPQQGETPLTKANAFANGEFSAEMKEQLRREMFQSRKNL